MLENATFMPSCVYKLAKNRIDIWEFPLDKLPGNAILLLNEAELSRANRYYFPHHKRRFIAARAMLRLILSRYLQLEARHLDFNYNKQGKPHLNHLQALEFNLSHSGDLALLAVGQLFPLGIDLEFFSARPFDGIASNLFSAQELSCFLNLPSYRKPQAFFQIWAQKEAFIKACGLGLSYPTSLFDVPVLSTKSELVNDSLHNKQWVLQSFMPQVACHAALCHHPSIEKIHYFSVTDLDDYLDKAHLISP